MDTDELVLGPVRVSRPETLLRRALKRQQKKNPACSLRWLARKIGVSHVYLLRVLGGEKPFPQRHFSKLVDALEIDDSGQALLRMSIAIQRTSDEQLVSQFVADILHKNEKISISRLDHYDEIREKDFCLHDSWYNLAILDLVTCSNFKEDPDWIAKKLGISEELVKRSIRFLLSKGYLSRRGDSLNKTNIKLRFPTSKSHRSIRRYHIELIKKSIYELQSRTDEESFRKRLVMGISFAADPRNLRKAKERLTTALFEVAEILADGECTEVYQLNSQLFPLTQNLKEKSG